MMNSSASLHDRANQRQGHQRDYLSVRINEYEDRVYSNTPSPDGYDSDEAHVEQLKRHFYHTSRSVWRGREGGDRRNLSETIFTCPSYLLETPYERACLPEVVSIGPYHHGRDELLEFEEYKWCYFFDCISTTEPERHRAMSTYIECMKDSVSRAKSCYSKLPPMSDDDFIKIMVLDGCFVVELLKRLGGTNHEAEIEIKDDPILTKPWLIPVLIADLLKLENQIPFFVLESLWNPVEEKESIEIVALRVFNLLFQMPWHGNSRVKQTTYDPKHLLDLFHNSLRPSEHEHNSQTAGFRKGWLSKGKKISKDEPYPYHPWTQSIQSVKQLRSSGIRFKPKKEDTFLNIKFRNSVLEIPSIAINDWTSTILLNCVALEQARNDHVTFFTSYIVFMKSLMSEPRDAAYLCSDGIITSFSNNDQFVARFFNILGGTAGFNVRNSYLDRQIREVERYYSSHWATMKREYFSSPWASISVLYALFLLLLNLTQTVFSILSYVNQINHN